MVFLLVAAVGPTGDALPIRHEMRPPCRDAHGVGDGLATHECQRDWLVYGERFEAQRPLPGFEDIPSKVDPERLDAPLLKTGLDRGTLHNYAYVSRCVPRSLRNELLSWEHHKAVARLDPDAQRHWIEIAITENEAGRRMSSRRLRRSIDAGRIITVEELKPDPVDKGILNHIPFVNRLVGWWSRMRE